ncbi:hypothetical protein TNCV_4923981 [Trichonephila clavipes]|nr:hypothetical protein TNCV_4923981 [Trichonephila clavipes]
MSKNSMTTVVHYSITIIGKLLFPFFCVAKRNLLSGLPDIYRKMSLNIFNTEFLKQATVATFSSHHGRIFHRFLDYQIPPVYLRAVSRLLNSSFFGSGGLESACPFRKPKVAGLIPTGVGRFSGG